MNTYLVLYHPDFQPKKIKAEHVQIENDYTEFILNRHIVARFYKCIMWELLNETESP